VDGEAFDAQITQRGRDRRELVSVEPVARHRRLALDDDARRLTASGKRLDVLETPDGVDDSVVVGDMGEKRSPWAEHHDVAAERGERVGHLVVGADGEHRAAE
jgi:hypothetical protein